METETALATISTFQDIIVTSNAIAEQNSASLAKALQVADTLIKQIDETEIKNSPEVEFLDQSCLSYLQKAYKTVATMNERRKPITQAFDQIRKYFTEQENQLSKTGEKIIKIQKFRNDWAIFMAAEEDKREKERQLKAAMEQERIDCRAYFKTKLSEDLINTLDISFNELSVIFESIKLSDIILKTDEIKNFSKEYKPAQITYPYRRHLTQEEHDAIFNNTSPSEIAKNEVEYGRQISEKIQYYLDRVDSKKQELIEMASANAAEKQRLQKEAEERMAKEAEEKRKQLLNFFEKKQTTIEAEKTESSLNNLFEQGCTPISNAKKTLQIEVLNPAGYGQIFMFWFEREGKNLTNEKIEKKSIAQMKKFCEDIANKDGEIINSSSISYKEVVTASNK